MISASLGIQVDTFDASTNPVANIMAQAGEVALLCPNGVMMEDTTLAASSANIAFSFPVGVTTAVFIYIASITTTDLIIKVGTGSPFSLSIPLKQGMFFYGITSANISINSVLGGKIQYAVGG